MSLSSADWGIVLFFLGFTVVVGAWSAIKNARNSESYFLGGRNMPWWLLGMSMVATTFSTDTPNLVTNIVRTQGVAGNWAWWSFLLSGMLTTFVYARLWRRLGVTTDIEFYHLRYSGPAASILRGFRAGYLGIFFNVMIMATVTLAAIKIAGVTMGLSPIQVVLIAGLTTVLFSTLGGFVGVLVTDAVLFVTAIVGAIVTAWFALEHPDVGGLSGLFAHPSVIELRPMLPDFSDPASYIPLFLVPIAVQWWAVWYPGSEPGGGGYIAQRMLAAKDENHATAAVAFFNFAHYAIRPWPWIIVALASVIVFPDLASLAAAFPGVDPSIISDDLAYSAMLSFLPSGALGLVLASLMCAYISTISTHLNWGASYVVNDLYLPFVKPSANDSEQLWVGRGATVLLMLSASLLALALEDALQAFRLLLTVGAGTGLIFILRWFWQRINVWSEISAMIFSFLVAVVFEVWNPDLIQGWQRFLMSVGVTTICWMAVTLLTAKTDDHTYQKFQASITSQYGTPMISEIRSGIGKAIACSLAIYLVLFFTGYLLMSL
jgi:Na+/proline symporter